MKYLFLFCCALLFLTGLCGCMQSTDTYQKVSAPYPPSPMIDGIEFDTKNSIMKAAIGSDNWPITRSIDDLLYTAYGDGYGFKPKVDIKLSNGIAVVRGHPPYIKGENIRTTSGETIGDGPKGLKASGMLMVGKTLYMLLRNADQNGNGAKLMWSENNGLTWENGYPLHREFGCPTFLNSGPGYINHKDDYIYVYSQMGPNAYKPYDHAVLARIHKTMIKDPNAWEFFQSLNEDRSASWSKNPKDISPVFSFEDHCFRMEVVYIEPIDRYLMLIAYNFDSGWGIYDAPSPYGPWTTAFHTTKWDIPRTHAYRLPTKWYSENSNSFYLVFSGLNPGGYDAFCVRKATVTFK